MTRKRLTRLYAIIIVLLMWAGLHEQLQAFIVPDPIAVFRYLLESMLSGQLIQHVIASLLRIMWAMLGTVLIGAGLGLLAGSIPLVDFLLTPIVYLFYPIPRVAFLPVFLLLLGLGEQSKVALMIAVAAFYIYIPLRDTLQQLPQNYTWQAKQFGFTIWQRLVYIILPALGSELFTALKLVLGTSMATLFFVENYVTQWGLGYFIMNSWFKSDYVALYAGIVLLSFIGNILFDLLALAQRYCLKWQWNS